MKKSATHYSVLTVIATLLSINLINAQQLSLTASNFNGFNISCFGGNNGSIDLTISGGVPPYTILWSNSEVTEDISNLPAGYYRVSVDDADTLTPPSEAEITLIEPRRIDISYQAYQYPNGYNISVFGACNGSIDINVIDGVMPYTYSWKDGPTTQDRSSICASTYKVIVTDLNGCTALSENILMKEPERGDWQLEGNQNLDVNNQFIGTLDTSDLVFKTNNIESARIKSNGEFQINRLITDRIVSPDTSGIVQFGDNTMLINYNNNRIYGDPNSINSYRGTGIGSNVWAFGQHSLVAGYNSRVEIAATQSIVLGTNAKGTQPSTFVMGSGAGPATADQLINSTSNSILFGCNSNLPTMTITGAAGFGTTGKVSIGQVGTMPGNYKLYVQGGILSEKVKVAIDGSIGWADYVFESGYKLISLNELELYIKKNKHLPEIPSKEEVIKDGVDLLEMQIILLKKIEELTLYIIQQQKEIEYLRSK